MLYSLRPAMADHILSGFEPHELIGRSSLDLSHPDEVDLLQQHHA